MQERTAFGAVVDQEGIGRSAGFCLDGCGMTARLFFRWINRPLESPAATRAAHILMYRKVGPVTYLAK